MSVAMILSGPGGVVRHTATYASADRAYRAQDRALRDLHRGAADLYVLSADPGMPGYTVARQDINAATVRSVGLAVAPEASADLFDARRRACGDD
jgi:hypothetical protein